MVTLIICRVKLQKDIRREMIHVYRLHCTLGDKTALSVESSMQDISLEEVNNIFPDHCLSTVVFLGKIYLLLFA